MRIGIDGTPLTIPFPCGTRHYAEQLLSGLAKVDKKNQYVIFSTHAVAVPKQRNFRLVGIPRFFPVLKRQLFLPYLVKKEKVDVLHYLEPYGSVFLKHPKIITTVLDLDLGETYSYFSRYLLNRIYCELTRFAVFKKTNSFIVISEAIKNSLIAHLGKLKRQAKTDKVYIGVNERFKQDRALISRNAESGYFLCMGDFSPRKNIERVIEAYSELSEETRKKYKLRIILSSNAKGNRFALLARRLKLFGLVEISGNVPLSKLVKLYNQAKAFLYPSLYEGFGIPILEAMACGCPVITSDRGAMKEVAGDAALLVNPEDTADILRAMRLVLEDKKTTSALQQAGVKRAKRFSWEQAARKTLAVYTSVYMS